jgi:hypothetical protein
MMSINITVIKIVVKITYLSLFKRKIIVVALEFGSRPTRVCLFPLPSTNISGVAYGVNICNLYNVIELVTLLYWRDLAAIPQKTSFCYVEND